LFLKVEMMADSPVFGSKYKDDDWGCTFVEVSSIDLENSHNND
jgi:hypothetical protein